MAPLIGGVVVAGLAAGVVGWSLARVETHAVLPVLRPIALYVAVAVAAGIAASLAAFPALRRGIRPDALHHE